MLLEEKYQRKWNLKARIERFSAFSHGGIVSSRVWGVDPGGGVGIVGGLRCKARGVRMASGACIRC